MPLTDTLQTGKIYCVTYYVSPWNDCKYSTDKFGALFTSVPFDCSVGNQTLTTGYIPQVVSPAGVIYDDTLNWQEVSGTFTATGTEAYLTIGNFFTNAQHIITLSYPGGVRNVLEYYLDDVSVEEVQPVICRNDTSIVLGDSAIVGINSGEANLYSWQPTTGLSCTNCPNPKASPSVTTTYTVTKTQCKVTTTDVITVSVSPTGISDISYLNEVVGISPNPTNGLVTITSRYDFEKVELTNVTGQLLFSEIVNNKTHQLQLQNFAEGIYLIKICYSNGLFTTKKIVVNR
ncbi:MAG: T9SS type A sorting domain-containing protein [Burkholderiales bacterium]|nr:T9SS type A sorting domain-containing protein [Bacteroidia bacterium]